MHPDLRERGLAWEAAERAVAERCCGDRDSATASRPLVTLSVPIATSTPRRTGRFAAHRRPTTRRTRTSTCRPQHAAAREGGDPLRAARHRPHRARPARGQPVSRRAPAFFAAMAEALSLGLAHPLAIVTPFASDAQGRRHRARRGTRRAVRADAVVHEPGRGRSHCGACSKCRERQQAFTEAGLADPTRYSRTAGLVSRRTEVPASHQRR